MSNSIKTKNHTKGINSTEWKDQKGLLHRDGGPAYVMVASDGTKMQEAYYTHGLWNRLDGPAVIEYYPDGKPLKKYWYQHGQKHRINGPAYEMFNENGKKIYNENWIKGKKQP